MTTILNVLWFLLGGCVASLTWLLAALLLAVTIVGLPWAAAAWRIGLFSFFPFGKRVTDLNAEPSPVHLILNILWFVLGGWYVALGHLIIGVTLLPFIVTIPFSIQHFKLAVLALAPVGKTIVEA